MPAANTNLNGSAEALTERKKRSLAGPALGSAFDPYDRLFPSYSHGGVFDYGHEESRDLYEMLRKDGKARAIEQVLTLPLRGADFEITGPERQFVEDNIPNLDLVIDQMTSAAVYRKAFFEKVWKLDGGRVVYDKLAFRPALSCAAWYHEVTGDLKGFRQRTRITLGLNPSSNRPNMALPKNHGRFNKLGSLNRRNDLTPSGKLLAEPGWTYIPIEKSLIYVHGLHRDPIRGISDMDVAYWAYETRRKVMFLWFQFLENVSLPKTIVYGDNPTEANNRASEFASLKGSGVLGLERDQEGRASFETIDSAGQGAAQFESAIRYLESMMTQSVLASFMDLPASAAQGQGSYALSADQSEFFLVSRQAVADEMAQCINRNLIGPLVNYNFGDVELPKIEIGPLSNRTTERALALLTAIIAAPQVNVPMDFVGELVKYTASYLGLNEDQVVDQVDAYTEKRKQDDEETRVATLELQKNTAKAALQPAQPFGGGRAGSGKASGGPKGVRNVSGSKGVKRDIPNASADNKARSAKIKDGVAASMSDAIDAIYDLVDLAEAGYDPKDLLARR